MTDILSGYTLVSVALADFLLYLNEGRGQNMLTQDRKKVHYELIGNCLVIYVTDDLDHHAVTSLREYSDGLIDAGNIKHIIFDFARVGFMDSSGIGLIMGRYKKVMFLGGRAAVTRVGDVVNRIFTLSGLYQIIEKYDTVEEALHMLQKSNRKGEEKKR